MSFFGNAKGSGKGKYEVVTNPGVELSKSESGTRGLLSRSRSNSTDTIESEQDDEKKKKKKSLSLYALMKVLSPYFWPASGSDGAFINRIRSTSTWIMVTLSKTCSLCAPYYIAEATNLLGAGDFNLAMKALLYYILLKFSSSTFKELQSVIYVKVKQQANIQLQEMTFSHLHTLSLNWHLNKKTGSVIKSMDRGVDAANSLVTYLFLMLVPALLEVLAVIILFFFQYQSSSLSMIVFLGISGYCTVTILITQWRKKYREASNKHDNEFHEKATDSIINYETVKYFTGETFEIKRYTDSVIAYQKNMTTTQYTLHALNITQQLILMSTLFAALYVAGKSLVHGDITMGAWIAIQIWVMQIFAPLSFLGSAYSMIYQGFIDIRNLSELLSESPDVVDIAGATPLPLPPSCYPNPLIERKGSRDPDLPSFTIGGDEEEQLEEEMASRGGVPVKFENIFFNYPGQSESKGLKDVTFTVPAGTTTAIVGHTGAGKTTISRLLFRFYDPRDGRVLIDGHDIKIHTQGSVRGAIGIVPQDTVLFNDTILYNIAYGKIGASFEEIRAAAKAAQILHFIESLSEGWESMVGERGLKLSGGEKQRVAIARCLLKNPPIVLLDEATSALDTITENSIKDALTNLGRNRTVLIIAHRLSTIRNADQIVVLDDGRVAECGSHDDLLLKDNSIYKDLWNMQTNGTGTGTGTRVSSPTSTPNVKSKAVSSDILSTQMLI